MHNLLLYKYIRNILRHSRDLVSLLSKGKDANRRGKTSQNTTHQGALQVGYFYGRRRFWHVMWCRFQPPTWPPEWRHSQSHLHTDKTTPHRTLNHSQSVPARAEASLQYGLSALCRLKYHEMQTGLKCCAAWSSLKTFVCTHIRTAEIRSKRKERETETDVPFQNKDGNLGFHFVSNEKIFMAWRTLSEWQPARLLQL